MMDSTSPLRNRATEYARDVLAGRLDAGEAVRLACKRHMDDLESSRLAPYRYYFDVEESERIIDFAETLTIAEGDDAEPVTCYPFQCFILGSINGWRIKEKGYRRYRTSYIQMGRQNGKSFINGILAAYYGNFDTYKYGQIYCTATKKDQADIVFNEVVKFIRSDEDLDACFKVHEHNGTIDCLVTHSKIRALSGDTKSIDGFRPFLGIVDEYHAHRTNKMYKLLEGGIKKMKSALISVITTAGFDLRSPCYKLYEYCMNILRGVAQNDSQFIYIAQMDEDDDLWTPKNWIKANPILAYDPDALENLIPIANAAREMGGDDLQDFLVKQLNKWVEFAGSRYIKDIALWKQCGQNRRPLSDFRGRKCYVGVDLSSGGDLTTIALVFPFMDGDVKKYYIYSHSFIPSKRASEHIQTDNAPYDLWINAGLCTVTETLGGIKTDYKYILTHLGHLIREYEIRVQMICYDPHNASAFLGDLEAMGYNSLSVTQSAKNLNDATVDFRLEVYSGNVEFDGANELLTWSMATAKTISNAYGEIKIDKDLRVERIDPCDAVIDAWTMAMKDEYQVNADELVNEWMEMVSQYSK